MIPSPNFKVLFAGDSITRGMPGASYLEIVAALMAEDHLWAGAQPVNAGRGGDTVEALLHRISGLLELHRPRWAVLAIGHNDVWLPWLRGSDPLMDLFLAGRARILRQVPKPNLSGFEASYRALLDTIQHQVGERVVICTCSVIGEDLSSPINREMSRFNGVIRKLAHQRELELADVGEAFARELALHGEPFSQPPVPNGWKYIRDHLHPPLSDPQEAGCGRGFYLTLDGIHPNARGAETWARVIYEALSSAARRLGA